jgi:flavin-dependent dehydrogenase
MRCSSEYDVAIIGGGPAGAAAGTQLAKAGLKPVILEKEKFPRFCIGESLLPFGNILLKQLGVWNQMEEAGFLRKYGAEFCTGDKTRLRRFWFGQTLGASCEYSYQVERSKFDHLLLKNARSHGCQVHEETRVKSIENLDSPEMKLLCETPQGALSINARWIIDASGRNAFTGKKLGMRRNSTQKKRRVAIYGHFQGVFRNAGKAEGHITIARISDAWFWLIPLADNKTSIGLVVPSERVFKTNDRTLDDIFHEAVEATPEVKDRMKGASPLGPLRATGDYSWKFSSFASSRVVLAGDAAGFIDPIFSSGVMLALKSSMRAAELIIRAEKSKRRLNRFERFYYTRQVMGWMRNYSRLIVPFYEKAGFEVFMNPAAFLQIPSSIARLVGGQTEQGLVDYIRIELFGTICRLQRFLPVAPVIPSLR